MKETKTNNDQPDQKLHKSGDKWPPNRKHSFLAIFDPRSSIVRSDLIAAYPVIFQPKKHAVHIPFSKCCIFQNRMDP